MEYLFLLLFHFYYFTIAFFYIPLFVFPSFTKIPTSWQATINTWTLEAVLLLSNCTKVKLSAHLKSKIFPSNFIREYCFVISHATNSNTRLNNNEYIEFLFTQNSSQRTMPSQISNNMRSLVLVSENKYSETKKVRKNFKNCIETASYASYESHTLLSVRINEHFFTIKYESAQSYLTKFHNNSRVNLYLCNYCLHFVELFKETHKTNSCHSDAINSDLHYCLITRAKKFLKFLRRK